MRTYLILLASLIALTDISSAERVISFEDSLELAHTHSPALKVSRQTIEMRIGVHIQSKAYPNPNFSYSVENIFGNKHWRGWDAAESRYELVQPIILGNKRCHLQRAAAYATSAAFADYTLAEIRLSHSFKQAFIDVVAAQELFFLAQEQKCVSDEILMNAKIKVESGKLSPIYQNRALLERSHYDFALEKARGEFESLKSALALFWGSECPDFDLALYPFYHIEPPKCMGECSIEKHPAILKAKFLYSAAVEELAKERAEWVPDADILIGYKTEREFNERGMILGISFPLPIFDCNRGNSHRAEAEMFLLDAEISDVELRLQSKLRASCLEAARSYQQAAEIQAEILKLAEDGYSFAKQGYEEGKFEYLDVLDAKKVLLEIRSQYIHALWQFLKKNADIEYLTI